MEFGNRQKYFVEMVFIRVVSFGEHRFRQGIMVFWEAEMFYTLIWVVVCGYV